MLMTHFITNDPNFRLSILNGADLSKNDENLQMYCYLTRTGHPFVESALLSVASTCPIVFVYKTCCNVGSMRFIELAERR